jgi:hypothetical protein
MARFGGIATELFANSATCSFAQHKIDSDEPIISAGPPESGSIIISPAPGATTTSAAISSRRITHWQA